MSKIFSVIFLISLFVSCASPKNVTEYREATKDSSLVNKDTILLKNKKLSDIKRIFQNYGEKCFKNVTTKTTGGSPTQYGYMTIVTTNQYFVEFESQPDRESMVLKGKSSGMDDVVYFFLMDAIKKNNSDVEINIITPKAVWGSIFHTKTRDTNIMWAKGTGKACPILK